MSDGNGATVHDRVKLREALAEEGKKRAEECARIVNETLEKYECAFRVFPLIEAGLVKCSPVQIVAVERRNRTEKME